MPCLGRRQFFRALAAEAFSLIDVLRDSPRLRMEDLKTLPDETLQNMVPVFNDKIFSQIEGRQLLIRDRNGRYRSYCPLDAREVYILNCFDGRHSLDGIRNCLVAEFQSEPDVAYSEVKSLFLRLAEAFICQPEGWTSKPLAGGSEKPSERFERFHSAASQDLDGREDRRQKR